jgi:hypothetical protein
VDRSEDVSTSCKHTMSGNGSSAAMAAAMRFIALRVLAIPRVECPKYRTL